MNIRDRLALLKGGYTKKEIEALIEAEKNVTEEVKEEVTETTEAPVEKPVTYNDVMEALINEVKDLKNVIYQKNINEVEINNPIKLEDEAEKVLASLINPFNNKED